VTIEVSSVVTSQVPAWIRRNMLIGPPTSRPSLSWDSEGYSAGNWTPRVGPLRVGTPSLSLQGYTNQDSDCVAIKVFSVVTSLCLHHSSRLACLLGGKQLIVLAL
jgi:hypothetical protein